MMMLKVKPVGWKWVGLLRKRNAFWKRWTMSQDLLNSCVIVSLSKLLFPHLKSGYNIGNVRLRVLMKMK